MPSEFSSSSPPSVSEPGVCSGAVVAAGVRVKIIGIGNAGAGTLGRLSLDEFPFVRRAVVDTDEKALSVASVPEKVQIGRLLTRGLGTGGEWSLGIKAAEGDRAALESLVLDTDLVFILAALGGGTGGGVAPLVAKLATRAGATVIAFAFMPFALEGGRRTEQARNALSQLNLECGAAIPVSNDQLLQAVPANATAMDAFALADSWVARGIGALCSALFKPGLLKVDFASLRSVIPLRNGRTLFSIGRGQGADALERALEDLFSSPLLQRNVRNLPSLLVSIQGGLGLSLAMVYQIVERVTKEFGGSSDNKIGAIIEESRGDSLELCVIGTIGGIPQRAAAEALPAPVLMPEKPAETLVVGGELPRGKKGGHTQTELFSEGTDLRGFSSDKIKTDPIEGQDVDIPAYLRRGIKIVLG